MAIFRKVHTCYWDDVDVEKKTPEGRYFDLFLYTNPLSTECGIYEISKKKMCYWTGYNEETINKLLSKLVEEKKIIYNDATCEIAILNRGKYLNRAGKPVIDCILAELQKVKDKALIEAVSKNVIREDIRAIYESFTNRDTIRPTIRGQEEEEEKEELQTNDSSTYPFEKIQKLWIKTIGRNPRPPEVYETEKLIKTFGEQKVERIFREATLRNVKSLKYILDNVNPNGELIPYNGNGKQATPRRELNDL